MTRRYSGIQNDLDFHVATNDSNIFHIRTQMANSFFKIKKGHGPPAKIGSFRPDRFIVRAVLASRAKCLPQNLPAAVHQREPV